MDNMINCSVRKGVEVRSSASWRDFSVQLVCMRILVLCVVVSFDGWLGLHVV